MNRNPSRLCRGNTKNGAALCFFIAVSLIAACAAFYVINARTGLNVYDERGYITIVHRFINGDRPIADDWSTAMTLSFFLALPVKIFTETTGSTEGLVLFCRYLFIAAHTAFSLALFISLRKCRWAAVVASLLYMCYVPLEMYSLNYNPISMMAAVTICLLLFNGKSPGKGRLIVVGVVAALGVLALPPLALLYPAYSLCVLFRLIYSKKSGKDLREMPLYRQPAGWLFITAGIAATAAVFVVYILLRMSVKEIVSSVTGIMTQINSSYYNLTPNRISGIVNALGLGQCIAAALLLLLAYFMQKRSAKQKLLCFALIAADAIAMYVSIYITFYRGKDGTAADLFAAMMRAVPLALAGLAAFILTRNRNGKWGTFYLFCIACAFVRDISSNVVFGIGSVGANIASVMMIRDFLAEMRQDDAFACAGEFAKRLTACLCVLPIVAALCCESIWKTEECRFHAIESSYIKNASELTDVIGRGPFKGIKTTPRVRSVIDDMMLDLDDIRANGKEKIYIAGTHQWVYLYLEDSYTACSSMFDEDNIAVSQMFYWELHPEKQPECIYIPIYNAAGYRLIRERADKIRDILSPLCSFRQTEGRAGYILYDVHWK